MDSNDTTKSNFSVYKEFFEAPFIAATEVYYKTESEKFISENSIPDYMKKVLFLFLYACANIYRYRYTFFSNGHMIYL